MNSAKLPLINKEGEQDDAKENCSCTTIYTSFLLLTSLALLLTWVVVLPRRPLITITEANIEGYTLTGHNHLNAAFKFVVRVHNPNTKLSLYYDHIEFKAYHGGQTVAYDGVEPILQPYGNMTLLSFGGAAIDMPLFESPGEVDLILEMKGRLWFKAGSLALYRYNFKVVCFPVVIYLNQTGFEKCSCYLILE